MTLTSRERVIRTLNHEAVDRAPRDLWIGPAVEKTRADEVAEMLRRFPLDIERAASWYATGDRPHGLVDQAGQHTDAWGCVWHVTEPGTAGQLQGHPLAHVSAIAGYQPPWKLLDAGRMAKVDRACAATTRFVLAWTETRPFDRLQHLRGTSAALVDMAYATKEVRKLLAMLHDFFCREMEMWAASDVDGVVFMDDWGMPTGLAVEPDLFRDLFKPLYREYCRILRAKDKYVFFRSDGCIAELLPDLVEVGIDAVNCQLACMDVERLAADFRNRVTFWGDIDREHLLPLGHPNEIREAVRRVRNALDFGRGGLIAQCQWGLHVPFNNVAAAFDAWLQGVPMNSAVARSRAG